MKCNLFLLVTIIIVLGASQGFGHPPDSLSLDYNQETHILKVTAFHPTKDVFKHIIAKIVVKLNNKEVVAQEFLSQMNREKQEVVYMLFDAKAGDKITVIATCNVYGKGKKTIQLKEE